MTLSARAASFSRICRGVKVDDGIWIDVYNLHTDAGSVKSRIPLMKTHTNIPLPTHSTEDGDEAARTSNVQQVADQIDAYSIGNAVLVFGDTNSRYTRAADNIALFTTQNGLTDAWVALEHAGTPPAVESLFCSQGNADIIKSHNYF